MRLNTRKNRYTDKNYVTLKRNFFVQNPIELNASFYDKSISCRIHDISYISRKYNNTFQIYYYTTQLSSKYYQIRRLYDMYSLKTKSCKILKILVLINVC